MEILKFSIAAGETKRFERAGRYIEVIEADSALSLFFFDENGGQADDAQGIVSGLYIEEPYKAFTVYSATAQSVTLLMSDGRGGSRRQPGNVSIIDKIDPSVMTGGAAYTAIGTGSSVLVLPATNVRGLVVRASIASCNPGAGGTSNVRLFGALVAPAGLAGGANQILMNGVFSSTPGVASLNQLYDQRRYLPPGWGLFVVATNTVAAAQDAGASVSFEIL